MLAVGSRHIAVVTATLVALTLVPVAPSFATGEPAPPETVTATMSDLPEATASLFRDDVAFTPPIAADVPFSLVGFTLPDGVDELEVRTRDMDGTWSDWTVLEREPSEVDGPDPGTAEAGALPTTQTTEPLWVGDADAFQVRIDGELGEVSASLIDTEGLSEGRVAKLVRHLAPRQVAPAADAAVGRPAIITRAQWGANESLRRGGPSYATPRFTVLHHTAGSNAYTKAQSASVVRGIYSYHTQAKGWSDIGYNVLIDRYGQVFEGRFGGIDRGVIGAHASGYNTGSIGVAVMGNHETADISAVALESVARVIAWKYQVHGIDPSPTRTITAGSRRINVLTGHRNVGSTACPGRYLYARMGALRSRVATLVGTDVPPPAAAPAPSPVPAPLPDPVLSPPETFDGQGVAVAQLAASAEGSSISGSFTLQTDRAVSFERLGIAVRDTQGGVFDVAAQQGVTVDGAASFSGSADGLPYGVYTAQVAYRLDDRWSRVGPSRTFMVGPTAVQAVPVTGDFNGDGREQPGWFHDGWWFLPIGPDGTTVVFRFGRRGDRPVTGDWNGNGRDGIGYLRAGNGWRLRQTPSAGPVELSFTFGRATDHPVVGDWNGNRRDGIGMYRDGRWLLRQTASNGPVQLSATFGRAGDRPVVGRWRSGRADGIGTVRGGTWRVRVTATTGAPTHTFSFGTASDRVVIGDWNGNGRETGGVVRAERWLFTNHLPARPADRTVRYAPTSVGPA
jgi:hypothetical protein